VSKKGYKKQTRLIDVLKWAIWKIMSQAENIDMVGNPVGNFITGDKSTPIAQVKINSYDNSKEVSGGTQVDLIFLEWL